MPEILSRLQKLVNDGFRVVFFSNQVSMFSFLQFASVADGR